MALMFQLEVAQKLMGEPGTKAYGPLSVLAQLCARLTRLVKLGPGSFRPAPKVESAVVQFEPRVEAPSLAERRALLTVLHRSFAHRRKTLANNWQGTLSAEALTEVGLASVLRAEVIAPATWLSATRHSVESTPGGVPIVMPVAPEFETWTEAPAADELRLIPIGGLGEFGMNALVVHSARSLFLVDCGQLFPSDDQPGIDSIVPDFAYLEPFADRIQAVLLTHGHEDHIGALPYFLRRWPVPVYGTAFTLGLVEGKLREHGLDLSLLHPVRDFGRVKVGDGEIEAEWIPVTHSIPDACALALHTPQGVLVHSGDFKIDPEPLDGRLTGMDRLKALGDAGVRLLMADSTNVGRPGRSPSESAVPRGSGGRLRADEGTPLRHHLQLQHPPAPDGDRPGLRVPPPRGVAGAQPGPQPGLGPIAQAAGPA